MEFEDSHASTDIVDALTLFAKAERGREGIIHSLATNLTFCGYGSSVDIWQDSGSM
jgi:hypothetical protein